MCHRRAWFTLFSEKLRIFHCNWNRSGLLRSSSTLILELKLKLGKVGIVFSLRVLTKSGAGTGKVQEAPNTCRSCMDHVDYKKVTSFRFNIMQVLVEKY